MNYNELAHANELYKEISKTEKKIEAVERLKDRAIEISKHIREINIQLSEGYIHTPQAYVSYERFITFLDREIGELKLERLRKEEELFAFSPSPYETDGENRVTTYGAERKES